MATALVLWPQCLFHDHIDCTMVMVHVLVARTATAVHVRDYACVVHKYVSIVHTLWVQYIYQGRSTRVPWQSSWTLATVYVYVLRPYYGHRTCTCPTPIPQPSAGHGEVGVGWRFEVAGRGTAGKVCFVCAQKSFKSNTRVSKRNIAVFANNKSSQYY